MSWSESDIDSKKYQGSHIFLRNLRLREKQDVQSQGRRFTTTQKVHLWKNAREADESGPIKTPERFQLQLARLPSPRIVATPSWLWGVYNAVSLSLE
jgi:hypothetical protein